jgi:diadenosine tetraphosphatase ApaH/serine/threonine PP2A family protein phosphatase
MLALVYDVHGNLPALETVLDDARRRGATRWLIGGDVAAFGGWPAETVAQLRELPNATWIRGNWERWAVERDAIPGAQDPDSGRGAILRSVAEVVQAELGDELVARLAALPESAALSDTARAWHGSPVSDVRSFLPVPGEDEDELLAGVTEHRLVFGHTHLPFRRIALRDDAPPVELVNPGSVGLPFDGDRRAAYATVDDDGRIEHHRLPYDHEAAIAGVLALADGAPWGGFVAGALDRAAF